MAKQSLSAFSAYLLTQLLQPSVTSLLPQPLAAAEPRHNYVGLTEQETDMLPKFIIYIIGTVLNISISDDPKRKINK